jgi:hypothetical protein
MFYEVCQFQMRIASATAYRAMYQRGELPKGADPTRLATALRALEAAVGAIPDHIESLMTPAQRRKAE